MKCSLCSFLCRLFSTLESKRQVLNVRTHKIFPVDEYTCDTIETVERIDNYHYSKRIHCSERLVEFFSFFFSCSFEKYSLVWLTGVPVTRLQESLSYCQFPGCYARQPDNCFWLAHHLWTGLDWVGLRLECLVSQALCELPLKKLIEIAATNTHLLKTTPENTG